MYKGLILKGICLIVGLGVLSTVRTHPEKLSVKENFLNQPKMKIFPRTYR